jgi:hypothetical protein
MFFTTAYTHPSEKCCRALMICGAWCGGVYLDAQIDQSEASPVLQFDVLREAPAGKVQTQPLHVSLPETAATQEDGRIRPK